MIESLVSVCVCCLSYILTIRLHRSQNQTNETTKYWLYTQQTAFLCVLQLSPHFQHTANFLAQVNWDNTHYVTKLTLEHPGLIRRQLNAKLLYRSSKNPKVYLLFGKLLQYEICVLWKMSESACESFIRRRVGSRSKQDALRWTLFGRLWLVRLGYRRSTGKQHS